MRFFHENLLFWCRTQTYDARTNAGRCSVGADAVIFSKCSDAVIFSKYADAVIFSKWLNAQMLLYLVNAQMLFCSTHAHNS
jgi:hypothetical protein